MPRTHSSARVGPDDRLAREALVPTTRPRTTGSPKRESAGGGPRCRTRSWRRARSAARRHARWTDSGDGIGGLRRATGNGVGPCDTEPVHSELDELRKAEARDLLEINQARRARAEASLVLAIALTSTAVAVALGTHRKAVMIPVPAATLILLALAFQQYADVSVLGAARKNLERLLNERAGGAGLVYESAVSPIRQRQPLVGSVRALQSLVLVLTFGGLVGSTVIAFERSAAVWAPYAIATGLALVVACVSYRDMMRSGSVAAAAVDEFLGASPPGP